jgi:D-inositol-3-phosphate glycosyltransferase
MISVHSSPMGPLGTQDTGGMSVYIRELSRQLGRQGHAVDIYTRDGDDYAPGEARMMSENVRLVPLELGPAADAPKTSLYPHLLDFFHEVDRFRLQEGIAYDLIHSHYWLSGQVGRWARQAWGAAHITTFHTLGAVKNHVCGPGSELELRIGTERNLATGCDRLLVASDRERQNLIRFYDAEAARMAVVPCGVDLDLFKPMDRDTARRHIGADVDEKLILYVGRFAPEKGLDRLLRAVARLGHIPRLRLIVVGGDSERDAAYRRMLELSRTCGIANRVTFTGRVDQSELPLYYNAADLLAVPSSYESFGMVALEALACGTRVAATRVGAMEDLLWRAGNGRLVQDFRPSSLADALEGLLRDRAVPSRVAETTRRSVMRYDWTRVAADVLAVYNASMAAAPDGIEGSVPGIHSSAGPSDGCGYTAFTPA